MEREVWIRGAMVLAVLVLAVLIFITPALLGRPTTGLGSLPLLIVGMTRNDSAFIVYAGAAVQAYRYDLIRLSFNDSLPSVNGTFEEAETYGLHRWVPANASFNVHAYFQDRDGNYFEYNVSGRLGKDQDNHPVMIFSFPYEKDNLNTVIKVYPPNDFRQYVPRRGGTIP